MTTEREIEREVLTEAEVTGIRRSVGDLVWKVPGGGFILEGCFVVIEEEHGENIPCLICSGEECVEWTNARVVQANSLQEARERTERKESDGEAHHISECEMRDDRDSG